MTHINFTDANLQIFQDARNLKSKKLRLARHYIAMARRSGVSEKSPTFRSWQLFLTDWRDTPITSIVADMKSKGTL